jgi:hypothetical protein
MKTTICLLLIGMSLGLTKVAEANTLPLSFVCTDKVKNLELSFYGRLDWYNFEKSILSIRNLGTGEVTTELMRLSPQVSKVQILISRDNLSGGYSSGVFIFTTKMVDGILIGSGFGIENATCVVVNES